MAYFHAAAALFLYLGSAWQTTDWLAPVNFLATAVVLAPLGYMVGRRRSAAAAGLLLLLVLGLTILQIMTGGQTPSVIVVGVFAWIHGQAFLAARELAVLAGLQFDIRVPAT